MEQCLILNKADFGRFIDKLSASYDVYFPIKKKDQRFFKKYEGSVEEAVVGEVRAFEPLKVFFSRARERVAEGFQGETESAHRRPVAIIGAKACDLKGMQIQDFVFRDRGIKDPFYGWNRGENLIISADCTCAIETCFCLALAVFPHPTADFDLNLSPLGDCYVVERGSDKGIALVKEHASLFRTATDEDLRLRDKQRARVAKEVEGCINTYQVPRQEQFPGIIERNFTSGIWEDEAKTCVECGACTQICPTCHCFLLYDQKNDGQMARFRGWDSCMLKDYARVAGGGNPRKRLWMRLRNRFDKKFDFFPKVAHLYACTGCGRCVSACPAKIDIRRVLKRLVDAHA